MKSKGKGEQLKPIENKGKIVHLQGLVTMKTLGFHNFFQLKKNTQLEQQKPWPGQ